ncbi:MAG: hypothetical protein GKS06_11705 [Acidobacteria bacterium]|nr:hypothetical protein [Acidobacteriota bacterium]
MSEGRHELDKAIEVWEQRHAAAVRAKREAEVVMPFLRAAVEELDNFRGDKSEGAVAPAAVVAPPVPEAPAPNPFDGGLGAPAAFEVPEVSDEGDVASEDETATDFPSFQPRAISALMDDEGEDDEAALG